MHELSIHTTCTAFVYEDTCFEPELHISDAEWD